MVNDVNPDVVWVGLGLRKQERWVCGHKKRILAPAAIGVGAAFGFLAGKVKRAPQWVGNRGLEWLWRFAVESRRLWRRDMLDGPRFVFQVAMEMMGLRKHDYSALDRMEPEAATVIAGQASPSDASRRP